MSAKDLHLRAPGLEAVANRVAHRVLVVDQQDAAAGQPRRQWCRRLHGARRPGLPATRGSSIQKQEPRPGVEETPMRWPSMVAERRTIARPRPMPSVLPCAGA
jgi:hypothetical protein